MIFLLKEVKSAIRFKMFFLKDLLQDRTKENQKKKY